jgi:hypothetical protein
VDVPAGAAVLAGVLDAGASVGLAPVAGEAEGAGAGNVFAGGRTSALVLAGVAGTKMMSGIGVRVDPIIRQTLNG